MIPIIFVNTRRYPFVDKIIGLEKVYETRNRNTLGALIGRRVLIAETGHGKPIVRCSAVIKDRIVVCDPNSWEIMRRYTQVPAGEEHDWNANTKIKHLYWLTGVVACQPFIPPEGKRHGRVWMEYEN